MNILILGGTKFLGRHVVESAVTRGHSVTIFHRGNTNPGLFPEAEEILGDRTSDLDKLCGKSWDAVVDTCGYFPRIVKMSVDRLARSARQYIFISSISVFTDLTEEILTEDSPVGKIEDETIEEITGESYGPLKALCEQVVSDNFPGVATNVRPGLIVGPYDPSDRFTYWPVRMARGGDVLVPDVKSQPCQVIDVRDLADFIVTLIENKVGGTFNATGTWPPYKLGDVLEECRRVAGPEARLVWVGGEFLDENQVESWMDMPCTLPYDGSADTMSRSDETKAIAAGLTFRPLAETIQSTLDWAKHAGVGMEMKAGLTPEREAKLLEEWKEKASQPTG